MEFLKPGNYENYWIESKTNIIQSWAGPPVMCNAIMTVIGGLNGNGFDKFT